MHLLATTFQNSLMITGFVFVMMLLIEYLNVLTRGGWDRIIGRLRWGQRLLAAALGATPGCLGAYAVVSLYMHRVITLGTVVAAMIATSGDEAFVMLALFPRQALALFGILFVTGIASGFVTDLVTRHRRTQVTPRLDRYAASHPAEERCVPFSRTEIATQWKHCSPQRGWLTVFLVLFLIGVLAGKLGHSHAPAGGHGLLPPAPAALHHAEHGHAHGGAEQIGHECEHDAPEGHHAAGDWDWVRVTLLLAGLFGLFVVVTVPEHFLEEHLWKHLARVHISRIFLWTFGALLLVHLLLSHAQTETWIREGNLPVLVIACLLGLIPESGPHLLFVTLYAQGAIPFSVLLASSVVQDGHGMIPLLAHSRRAFVAVKAINLLIGLLLGLLGRAMGW
jgi:hypothetical protein